MAFLGLFTYKNKAGIIYYLHRHERKNRMIYFFSKDPADALPALPLGYEVIENERTGLPMLRKKKTPGIMDMIMGADITPPQKNAQK